MRVYKKRNSFYESALCNRVRASCNNPWVRFYSYGERHGHLKEKYRASYSHLMLVNNISDYCAESGDVEEDLEVYISRFTTVALRSKFITVFWVVKH